MATAKTDIYVYAHWQGMKEPKCIGTLSAQQAKGRKAFSFAYDPLWIHSNEQLLIDPDIAWFTGNQYPNGKENFGVFLDSMPDTWGRTLMKRKAAQLAKQEKKPVAVLHDIDFLLGVHDESRMGALRFKLQPDEPFLNNDNATPTPPWATVRELQHAAGMVELNKDSADIQNGLRCWLHPALH